MERRRLGKGLAWGGGALALCCALAFALWVAGHPVARIAGIRDYPVRLVLAEVGPPVRFAIGNAVSVEDAAPPAIEEEAELAISEANESERISRADIGSSFAFLRTPAPVAERSEAAPPPPPVRRFTLGGQHEVMEMDFHLARAAPAGATLIRKDVFRAGQRIGEVELTIDGGARIFVSRASIERLFPDRLGTGEGDTIALAAMRERGIDLRYDPVGDVMVASAS